MISFSIQNQRSCEGYVFTGICLSTGGVSASVHAGIPPPGADIPWEQTSPLPQSRHPPRADTPLGADTPQSRHLPQSIHPPPEIRSLLRTVRILLECILVTYNFGTYGCFLEYVTLPFSIRLHTCIKCTVFRKECVLKLDLSLNWSCSCSRKRKTWRKYKSMCHQGLVLSLQQSYYHLNTTIFEDESGGGFWSKKNPECISEVSIL